METSTFHWQSSAPLAAALTTIGRQVSDRRVLNDHWLAALFVNLWAGCVRVGEAGERAAERAFRSDEQVAAQRFHSLYWLLWINITSTAWRRWNPRETVIKSRDTGEMKHCLCNCATGRWTLWNHLFIPSHNHSNREKNTMIWLEICSRLPIYKHNQSLSNILTCKTCLCLLDTLFLGQSLLRIIYNTF